MKTQSISGMLFAVALALQTGRAFAQPVQDIALEHESETEKDKTAEDKPVEDEPVEAKTKDASTGARPVAAAAAAKGNQKPEPARKFYILGDAAVAASAGGDGRAGAIGSIGIAFVSDKFRPLRGLVRTGTETSSDSSVGATILLPGPTAKALEISASYLSSWPEPATRPPVYYAPTLSLGFYDTKLGGHGAVIWVGRASPVAVLAYSDIGENDFLAMVDLAYEWRAVLGNLNGNKQALEDLDLGSTYYHGPSLGLYMKIKQIYGDGRFILLGSNGRRVDDLTRGQLIVSIGIEADLSFNL